MELRTLKEGSKTRIVLGVCCSSPFSFSAWALGEETAFLQKRTEVQKKIALPRQDSASEQRPAKHADAA